MVHVAVTAVGLDRPGIVAAVTGVLMQHGANLEDTAMTRLGGHFAMVLVVAVPGDEDAAALEAALAADTQGLTVTVRTIEDATTVSAPGQAWAVTVHGADRPGIVHRVTSVLADHQANIIDLSTRQLTTDAGTGYVVLLEVELPERTDIDALAEALEVLAADLDVDINLRPDEADFL